MRKINLIFPFYFSSSLHTQFAAASMRCCHARQKYLESYFYIRRVVSLYIFTSCMYITLYDLEKRMQQQRASQKKLHSLYSYEIISTLKIEANSPPHKRQGERVAIILNRHRRYDRWHHRSLSWNIRIGWR